MCLKLHLSKIYRNQLTDLYVELHMRLIPEFNFRCLNRA